ncbi:MAG: hypothetical protein R3C68_09935 [Myxococcota bacterium]
MASGFLASLQSKAPVLVVEFFNYRHKFEVATGIDCSEMFYERMPQPLVAAKIVEEFLESPDVDKYEDGVRYFFGHRIPD